MTDTTRLGVNDMLHYLWSARFKWREIGIALNIDTSTLQVIEMDRCRVDDRFVAVLTLLEKGGIEPCWKVLAKALSSPPVGITVTTEGIFIYS